jgi:Aspartyl protease/PDZ domain
VIIRKLMLGTLILATVSPATADDTTMAPVRVPFEMLQKGKLISGHLAVQVKINGKGPYRLVFDTGAPMILLSNRVGKEAGLAGANKQPAMPVRFGLPGMVRVGKLEIGSLVAEDVNAIVFDHPTVEAMAEVFGPIDGIVGFPFFARYRTSIDYKAKELTFVPNGYKPGDLFQTLMATLTQPHVKNPPPRVIAPAGQWGMRIEKAESDTAAGVMVAEVYAGGAAAKAGIHVGDRLLTLDGCWTDSVADGYQAAEEIKPGQAVEVQLRRDEKEIRLKVTPYAGF